MDYQIQDFIGQLKDPRRGQGQRHKFEHIIIITLMAILSGHQGLKGIARFASSNAQELSDTLNMKHGIPKFNTIRDVLNAINADLMAQTFITWMQQYHSDLGDDFVALDGKAVRSTVGGGNTSLQNFIAVVSAFGHKSGMVYGMESYENAKSAESQTLRDLVAKLGFSGVVFTMDALHTQKKLST